MNRSFSVQTVFALSDQLTAPLRRINETVSRFSEQAKLANRAGQLFDRGIRDAYRPLGTYGRAAEAAHRSTGLLRGTLSTGWGFLSSTTAQFTALAGAIGGVYGAQKLLRGIIDTGGRFEMLQARLDTSFKGDTAASGRVLSDMMQMAKETPFEIEGLTQSFLTLKNFGIDPYSGALRAAVEQSSALGAKTETLDAITRELGQAWARGKLQGDGIRTLVQNGVPIMEMLAKATGRTTDAIDAMSASGALNRDVMRKLFAVMAAENAGASARAMKTYSGLLSMISDSWTVLQKRIADAGAFGAVKDRLSQIDQAFSSFLGSRRGADFIARVSQALVRATDAVAGLVQRLVSGDLRGALRSVASGIAGIGRELLSLLPQGERVRLAGFWGDLSDTVSGLAGVVRMLRAAFDGVVSVLDRVTGNGQKAVGWLLGMQAAGRLFLGIGLGTAIAGIGKTILTVAGLASGWGAAVLAVGAAAGVIIANWEPLKAWFSRFVEEKRQGFAVMRDDLLGAWETIRARVLRVIDAIQERFTRAVASIRAGMRGILDYMNGSDGTEFGVPRAFKQSAAPAGKFSDDWAGVAGMTAQRYGIDPALFASLIHSESAFNPTAVSPTCATGIAQFTKRTGRAYGLSPEDRRDPMKSLDAAARYLRDLLARFGGDWRRAIHSYKGVAVGGARQIDVERAIAGAARFAQLRDGGRVVRRPVESAPAASARPTQPVEVAPNTLRVLQPVQWPQAPQSAPRLISPVSRLAVRPVIQMPDPPAAPRLPVPRAYQAPPSREQRVHVDNEITIIQDDRRARVVTKTASDGQSRTRVNVGRNRFGAARVYA